MPGSTGDSEKADWPVPWQSGSPTIGACGLPSKIWSVRQLETLGYGCDTGPGNQRSTICTGKLLPRLSWFAPSPPPRPARR